MKTPPLDEIPRMQTCFFGVSLHLGTQLFVIVSVVSSLKMFLSMWNFSFFAHLDCVARAGACQFLFGYFIVKVVLITVNAFLLFSIYTSKYFKFMLIWVWYTLLEGLLAFVVGIYFPSTSSYSLWRYSALLVWNMYGCLVVHSYYKQLSKSGGSGVAGI